MIDMYPHEAASSRPGSDPEPGETVPELGWPVGAVAERLGIAAPTLRSWDRRHGVGPSLRTRGNHRRYTELDIRRVLLMSRLTAQGVPAQSAADSVLAMDSGAIAERLDGDHGFAASGERDGLGRGPAGPGLGGAPPVGGAPASEVEGAEQDATDLVEAIVGAARGLAPRTMALLYRQVLRRRDVGGP